MFTIPRMFASGLLAALQKDYENKLTTEEGQNLKQLHERLYDFANKCTNELDRIKGNDNDKSLCGFIEKYLTPRKE